MKDVLVSEMFEAIERIRKIGILFDAVSADVPTVPVKNQLIMVHREKDTEWYVRQFLYFDTLGGVVCNTDWATITGLNKGDWKITPSTWEKWKFID